MWDPNIADAIVAREAYVYPPTEVDGPGFRRIPELIAYLHFFIVGLLFGGRLVITIA